MNSAPLRYLLAFGVLAVILAIGGAWWQSAHPATAGTGKDSFGTHYYGWRGLYDTLARLNQPVARSRLPPAASGDGERTFIFWETPLAATEREPAYLRPLRRWVENGGTVVVAPPRGAGNDRWLRGRRENLLLKNLLGDLEVLPFLANTSLAARDGNETAPRERSLLADVNRLQQAATELQKKQNYQLLGNGRFARLAAKIPVVTLPEILQTMRFTDEPPGGEPASLLAVERDGRYFLLGAEFAVGRGRVLVIAEPALIYNSYLGQTGNAALAVNLLASPAGAAVFDEFYHGHIAVKKAWQLFASSPQREMLAALLFFGLLAAWRYGVRLGPALPEPAPSRRNLLEYIAAFARLLQNGRTRVAVAQAVFSGALWDCRRQLHLRPRDENPDAIAAALSLRSPAAAEKFAAAARRIEQMLAGGVKNEGQFLAALRELRAIHN
ncbi:MAG: DUF4350 domain-containing protein [Planctomycetota bacterium]|jgi:hypothetical protein|nr:DUF4350 domain-containing protein [Planctomycetota bacterium]